MNTYSVVRFSRPARLFSFGLLDGLPWLAISRTGRLTNSPARTDVARFIHRAVRPARSPSGFGLERLATAFMNNPDKKRYKQVSDSIQG
jgi:hypothetical protein